MYNSDNKEYVLSTIIDHLLLRNTRCIFPFLPDFLLSSNTYSCCMVFPHVVVFNGDFIDKSEDEPLVLYINFLFAASSFVWSWCFRFFLLTSTSCSSFLFQTPLQPIFHCLQMPIDFAEKCPAGARHKIPMFTIVILENILLS